MILFIACITILIAICLVIAFISNVSQNSNYNKQLQDIQEKLLILNAKNEERENNNQQIQLQITNFILEQQKAQHEFYKQLDSHQINNLKLLTESLQNGIKTVQQQLMSFLSNNKQELQKTVDKLTAETKQQLQEISGQVDKRLGEGFEKTTATFVDIVKRLALIDEAQKKITELSNNVVSLQNILADKRSRGAFGEIQLEILISNILAPENFRLQYVLSNNKRVDCMLLLPKPTGNIAIDAKFPLESYKRLSDINISEPEKRHFEQQFKQDIRKHIQDISEKYIINGETADGAIMFIPAEAIFAEIHANHPDLVELSYRAKVWLTSPTTMMAILTTARAVLKDEATRKQINIIQKHLIELKGDFERFQDRMDSLAKHIEQASKDVGQVHVSAKKITQRFLNIEKVELTEKE